MASSSPRIDERPRRSDRESNMYWYGLETLCPDAWPSCPCKTRNSAGKDFGGALGCTRVNAWPGVPLTSSDVQRYVHKYPYSVHVDTTLPVTGREDVNPRIAINGRG